MKAIAGLVAALLTCAQVASARTVPVRVLDVHSTTRQSLHRRSHGVLERCTGTCTLRVERGDYVFVSQDEGFELEKIVSIDGPTVIEVHHGSSTTTTTGELLIAAGSLSAGIGLIVPMNDDLSAAMALGGLGTAVTGFALRLAAKPSIDVRSAPTVDVAFVPTKGGGALGVSLAF